MDERLETTYDRTGRLISVSPAFEKAFCPGGAARFIGQSPPYPWWPDHQRPVMMKIFANTIGLGGDKNEGVELLVNLKDCAGSIGSYVVSLVQLRDGNTKIVNRPLIELERVTEAISLLRDSLSGRDQATGATNSWSPEHAGLEILSPRERDVCRLLLSGKSAAEIADKLYISIHTARNHRKAIYRKLGVSSQIELIQTISPP